MTLAGGTTRGRSAARGLARSLALGLLALYATAVIPALIANREATPLPIVAADDEPLSDGMSTCVWTRSWGVERLASWRTRNVIYSGMPLIIDPEQLDRWPWSEDLGTWKRPLNEPWTELREKTLVVGWPLPAMKGTLTIRIDNAKPATQEDVDGGVTYVDSIRGTSLLPLRPVWPGFAIDLAVWAGAVHVVTLLVASIRVRRRRRRGQCVHCGHRRTPDQSRCVECGL